MRLVFLALLGVLAIVTGCPRLMAARYPVTRLP
jgi:hypothetical protein